MNETVLAKIAIPTTTDTELAKALERVNHGFEGGRVGKSDLASTLILRAINALDEQEIEEIRKCHFNQVAYLGALYKKLKASSRQSLSTDEASVLQAMLDSQSPKKRTKSEKPQQKDPKIQT